MLPDIFLITPLDVISWITFGFVVGLLVHAIKPSISTKYIAKDVILAILGSMVAGLTLVFFYGYTLLGILAMSLVGGLVLAVGYVWIEMKRHQTLQKAASIDALKKLSSSTSTSDTSASALSHLHQQETVHTPVDTHHPEALLHPNLSVKLRMHLT